MNKLLYILLFFCCVQTTLVAQQKEELDSLFKLTVKAFEFTQMSKQSEAIKLSNEILEYEKSHRNDSLRGTAYNILAISYTYLKDTLKSRQYFLKAADLYKKGSDTIRLISSYNNLGVFYRDYSENIEKSNEFFDKANTLAALSLNLDATIHPNYNMGVNYIRKGDITDDVAFYKKAIMHFEKAIELIEISKKETTQYVKSGCYSSLAYAYFKLKKYKRSEDYYNQSLEHAKVTGSLENIANAYDDRIVLLETVGRYKEANEVFNKLLVINDSINKVEKFAEAKAIESEYFIKENEERLKFVEKEKELQGAVIAKAKVYNVVLAILSFVLLFGVYYIFKKNKQLLRAKNKAVKLSNIKSEFYSEISHELRTPLYAVIELSNILLKENKNNDNKEYLESLKFSGNHLLSLINNVLELNKIESGKVNIERIEFNLKMLMTNIIDSLEYALRDANNTIELIYDESIPKRMVGDSLKLSQVLINLISNAIKFTNDGKITVEIKNKATKNNNIALYFAVKDNGVGIPLDKQKHIFDDFHQEQTKTAKSYKGTGLGLSIVKRLLDIMGSKIYIESEHNKGSTFYFSLNLSTVTKVAKVKLDIKVDELIDKSFLIVDDNKINQLVTRKILHQLDLKCDVVDSGIAAISATKEKFYDCILMDLNMPEMSGYEATQKIRQFNQDTAIVALTAASSDEIKKNILFYDMDGYVLKPFFTEDLFKAIVEGINKRNFSKPFNSSAS